MITGERITTLIDLVRHGEPVGGIRYRGQMDDPLSHTGWQEMRKAIGRETPWDAIISSPLLRCRAFAEDSSDFIGTRPLRGPMAPRGWLSFENASQMR